MSNFLTRYFYNIYQNIKNLSLDDFYMVNIVFKTPWILFGIPLVWFFIIWLNRRQVWPSIRFPCFDLIEPLSKTWRVRLIKAPFYLRLMVVALFIIALAGPRSFLEEIQHKVEGVDIVLAIDASGSMATEDFLIQKKRLNRLEVVKEVVEEFIDARKQDRLGIIAFAGVAYTVSPMTTDHSWLKTNLERIDFQLIEDGTAIGSAIVSSLIRLKKSEAKSKVIILLTDGINNSGKIDPTIASQMAKALGVKIYTIGAGKRGYAPFPIKDIWGRKRYRKVRVDIDEQTLENIATITEGKYYRATDTESLRKIYKDIDALEKTEIEEFGYREYKELFHYVLITGLIFLLLELILTNFIILKVP